MEFVRYVSVKIPYTMTLQSNHALPLRLFHGTAGMMHIQASHSRKSARHRYLHPY
jgi:hypothetical protein